MKPVFPPSLTGTGAGGLGPSPNPLLTVWSWELRRVAARRQSWLLALAAFLFFAGMVQFKHAWAVGSDAGIAFIIYGTSAVGVLYVFVNVLMFVFAFMLPFVVTGGVAADYRRRMHEVLMATPLPGWAYVWGRFLAVLTQGLLLSLLMLAAYLLVGLLLHQRSPVYPLPPLAGVLAVWLVLVLPSMILLAGLGFTLGTLWPRRSRVMILALLIAWMLLFTVGGVLGVNPTGNVMVMALVPSLLNVLRAPAATLPAAQLTQLMLQAQSRLPSLAPFVLPQYALAAVGLALVALAAAAFRRFRQLLG